MPGESQISIGVTAETSDAKRKLRELGEAGAGSIDRASAAADRLGSSLERAGKAADLSARRIASLAASMSGMLAQQAAGMLTSVGAEREGSYVGAIGGGAASGAALGTMLLPGIGTTVGAAGGAVLGGVGEYLRQLQEEEKAAGEAALAHEALVRTLRGSVNAEEDAAKALRERSALVARLSAPGAVDRNGNNRALNWELSIAREDEERFSRLRSAAADRGDQTAFRMFDAELGKVRQTIAALTSLQERQRDAAQRAADAEDALAEARERNIAALQGERERYIAVQVQTDMFRGLLGRLGDTSRSTADRSKELEAAISQREALLRTQMAAWGKAADAGDNEGAAKAKGSVARLRSELDALRNMRGSLAEADEKGPGRTERQFSNIQRMGGSIAGALGGAAETLQREGNQIMRQQLSVLQSLERKAGTGANYS